MRRLLGVSAAARRLLAAAVLAGVSVGLLAVVQANVLADALTGRPAYTALAAVIVGRAALHWMVGATGQRAAAAVKSAVRKSVLAHVQLLGPGYLARTRAGELTTLLTRGLDGLDPLVRDYIPALAVATVVPLAVLGQLAVTDPTSAVIVAATLPLIPIFAALAGMKAKSATEAQFEQLHRLGGHFLDAVRGLPTLRVFGRQHDYVETVRRLALEHRRATMRTLRIAFLSALTLELVATLSVALVAVPVALRLLDGHLDLRTALVVLLVTPEAYLPLRVAGQRFHAGAEGTAAAQGTFEVLDTPVPKCGIRTPPDIRTVPIRLDNVTVQYRNVPLTFDLEFRPGEQVALVGASGCGKSTLIGLLLGLVRPTSGRVLIGDIDLAELDPELWWRQIAWVPQRPHLFAGTVLDNVRLGRPDASAGQVNEAIRLAGAADFVSELPERAQTLLGERGTRLSTGQRQRIAIARALLRTDAGLVLLDEPGAGLDVRTETELVGSLPLAGRTAIVSAHRPAFVERADRVVSLDGILV